MGGYAFSTHAEIRGTKDLDVWIAVSEENSEAVYRALVEFGAPVGSTTPADFRDGESFFIVGRPPNRIDVLQKIDAVTFEEAWETRVSGEFNGVSAPVMSRDLLIRNKLAAGRPRDLLEVKGLQQAAKHQR